MNASCDLFLKALSGENHSGRPPIWLMRQAGRYMPEYRKIREKYSFLEMCHQPEIATEVTLLPINLLQVDAAILFSDILVVPEALGVGLHFEEGKGPIIERPLQTAQDVLALSRYDCSEKLGYVAETIALLRKELKVPLIGFCGAPFTLASYMISGGMHATKQWMMRDEKSFLQLLDHLTACTIDYVQMQEKAGAQAIQIFDSWANVLSDRDFKRFSLPYLEKICKCTKLPVLLFCRGSSLFAPYLTAIKPAGISIDWQGDLKTIREAHPTITLQGNLDPDVLYGSHDRITVEAKGILASMKNDPGFIFNLGHGVKPDIPFDAVKHLVDVVRASG